MSRIDELIEDLCPGGVEFKKLSSIVDVVQAPKKIQSKNYLKTGQFPIIDQGQSDIVGYTDDKSTLLPAGEYVLFGDHTLSIKYVDFKFAQGADGLKILRAKPNISTRYLYHCCLQFKIPSRGYSRHWTYMKEVKFPIPPLPVQEEIARILDTFTGLEAELEAELEARKKQNEYYRARLLTLNKPTGFNHIDQLIKKLCPNGAPFLSLDQICLKITDGAHSSPKAVEHGYFMPSVKDMRTDGFNFSECKQIAKSDYELLLRNGCKPKINDVLVAKDGSILKYAFVVNEEMDIVVLSSIAIFRPKTEIIHPKFLVHFLMQGWFKEFVIREYSSKGGVPRIILKNFKKIQIPVPPLPVQEQIVQILDRFDALCNDLTSGIPAEIAGRRKQYEYYRDKLLTFKELKA